MAKKVNISLKHVQIDKANTAVVVATAVAAFALVFTAFAINAMWNIRSYQADVIIEKEVARNQLEKNLVAAESLRGTYESFISTPINIIGGNLEGDGESDGDNARIILDALPSRYDFPALVTSLDRILSNQNVTIGSISGTDEELSQSDLSVSEPVSIPFGIAVSGNYDSVQQVVDVFERSIRPFHNFAITISGDESNMRLEMQSQTFFQPEKRFEIQRQELLP